MSSESSKPAFGLKVEATSLVEVQPGSVVSREVISKPQGTVSVFAFDKGEGLSEHTSPYDALIYALEGRVQVILGGEPQELSEGEMLVMPANVPHALTALVPFKMMLVMVRA